MVPKKQAGKVILIPNKMDFHQKLLKKGVLMLASCHLISWWYLRSLYLTGVYTFCHPGCVKTAQNPVVSDPVISFSKEKYTKISSQF